MARAPRQAPVMAAATVPEWNVPMPMLGPSFTPDRTTSGAGPKAPAKASCTTMQGVPPTRCHSAPSHGPSASMGPTRSEEHTSELQSRRDLVCRLLLEKKNVHTADEIARRVEVHVHLL